LSASQTDRADAKLGATLQQAPRNVNSLNSTDP